MHEPIIYNATLNHEVYRFTWLRTWRSPVTIRIEKSGNSFSIFLKITDGQGGYGPGKLVIAKKRDLEPQTWNNFKSKLDQANFWRLATKDSVHGLDGSRWILEGKLSNTYHVVDRWSPKKGPYYECYQYLISLVKPDIDSLENAQ